MKDQFIKSKANVKKFRDSVRSRIQLFRQEEKELIRITKSLMVRMEGASTAKLAISNPSLNKTERIRMWNQQFKKLVQSVKRVIRSQKQAETDNPDVAGSSKILVHPDLKELFIALLVKFGSAMIYANNQAGNAKRNSTDVEVVKEYKRKVEELQYRIQEMEQTRTAAEDVKHLLYQQVQDQQDKFQDREEELQSVYKNFDTIKESRKHLEINLKRAQEKIQRLNNQNNDLKEQLDDHEEEDVFDDTPSIESDHVEERFSTRGRRESGEDLFEPSPYELTQHLNLRST